MTLKLWLKYHFFQPSTFLNEEIRYVTNQIIAIRSKLNLKKYEIGDWD